MLGFLFLGNGLLMQGGIKGEGAVPTQSPTQAFLTRVSPKNTKSELPSLTCGTVRSTEQSKGFQQAEPQALPKGRYFQEWEVWICWDFPAGANPLIFVQKIDKFPKISPVDRSHRRSFMTNRCQTLLHQAFCTGRLSERRKFTFSSSTSRKIAISYAPYFSLKTTISLFKLEIVSQRTDRHDKFWIISGSRPQFLDFAGERRIFFFNLFNHE